MAEAVAATPSAEPDVPYLIVHALGPTVSSAHAHDALHAHTLTVFHSHPLKCPPPVVFPSHCPPPPQACTTPSTTASWPTPPALTQTPVHKDNAQALLPRPMSRVRAPLHNLPRRCSQAVSQMQRAHTHSPAYIPTTFSHACVHTHTHFQSLPHTITCLPLSLTNTPSAKRVAPLQSSPRSVCHCSPSRPPWPQALPFHLQTRILGPCAVPSFLCLVNINTRSVHLLHSAYVDSALIMG